jgi:type IV pilus assembly protein PilE
MNTGVPAFRQRGVTLAELLTALVVVAILAAVAVPMWRNHLLRIQRADAVVALVAVQNEQDNFFGRNARYADGAQLAAAPPGGLGLKDRSQRGFYLIELRSGADGLGYLATARAAAHSGQSEDTRCVEFTLDHNGRRRAVDSAGNDRSADCWH